MLNNLLYKLEDSNNPLLGPNIKALKFCGLLLSENSLSRYLTIFLSMIVILNVGAEYVDMWLNRADMHIVMENLKSSTGSTSCVFKVISMFLWQKHWIQIIQYISRTDKSQRSKNNEFNNIVIKKFTRYCRKITYIYWGICILTGFAVILQPILKYVLLPTYRHNVQHGIERYHEVARCWVPFDKMSLTGYVAASLIQSFGLIRGIGWLMSFDTLIVVILVSFRIEIEVLRNDCRNIFALSPNKHEETMKRLRDCHKRHIDLIRYTRLFNSCMSPVMFLYVILCTFLLCINAYHMTGETSMVQCLLVTEFIMFTVTQLFLYCWHSNEVTDSSKYLFLGPYESNWWRGSVSQQKHICMLIHQFNKDLVFTAGPFTELTVATFVKILKAAYSYYTILNQSRN